MTIPRCVAIIPDGNRRFARSRNRQERHAHMRGLLNARRIIDAMFKRGTEHVVFWGASYNNFIKREGQEILSIFRLFRKELLFREKQNEQIALYVRGAYRSFSGSGDLHELIGEAEQKTSCYKARNLTVLFGYDGILEGDEALISLKKSGDALNWRNLSLHAWTGHIPAVDLCIRTGATEGARLSGSFLPFKLRNTFLHFDKKFWPEFSITDLDYAYDAYHAYACTRRDGA